jgi:nucleotide-binding universal stress UspA family protein
VTDPFIRIVCAVDASDESIEAAEQVARLAPSEAEITLVGVAERIGPVPPGFGVATAPLLRARRSIEDALERAAGRAGRHHSLATSFEEGAATPTLLRVLQRDGATLVSVGIHHDSRAVGVALGSVATAMLHDAPCSVYVGRGHLLSADVPPLVVAGLDGSPQADEAFASALAIAARTGSRLMTVVALGGKPVDIDAIQKMLAPLTDVALATDDRSPIDALVESGAGLLVLGSRGLHGIHGVGSVSARVAHRAHCPVLIVRASNSPPV